MAALFSLAQGAMRTLTGRINQNNRDAVRIATPMATIGIRGSDILTAHVVTTNTTTNAVISGTLPVNTVIDMVTVTVGQATATVALTQTQLIAFQAAIAAGGPFGCGWSCDLCGFCHRGGSGRFGGCGGGCCSCLAGWK